MGVPLMLITLFAILPKSGEWMNTVKQTFGFVMLALPVFYFLVFSAEVWEPRLWAGLATVFLFGLRCRSSKNGFGYAIKIISFALAGYCTTPAKLSW